MQRKPGFPVANCSIKMPDSMPVSEPPQADDEGDHQQRRQQLINFGHSQWGFNNWSWSVTKQELDFVDFVNGKYCVGVASFVSVTVKSLDIHRENVGYATSVANTKGLAIYKSRKCAVTNALRETLLSFGGNVATDLMELSEPHKTDHSHPAPPEPLPENNQNMPNKPPENTTVNKNIRKDSVDNSCSNPVSVRLNPVVPPAIKNAVVANPPPPVAKAHPMPANLPPAANRPPLPANAPRPPHPANPTPHVRPNSNEALLPPPAPPSRPLEAMSEEEARAERLRRQRLAQEKFRQKQLTEQKSPHDDKQDLQRNSSSFDKLLLDIPTQDIEIEESGNATGAGASAEAGTSKRRSPGPDSSTVKRRASVMNRLNIVTD